MFSFPSPPSAYEDWWRGQSAPPLSLHASPWLNLLSWGQALLANHVQQMNASSDIEDWGRWYALQERWAQIRQWDTHASMRLGSQQRKQLAKLDREQHRLLMSHLLTPVEQGYYRSQQSTKPLGWLLRQWHEEHVLDEQSLRKVLTLAERPTVGNYETWRQALYDYHRQRVTTMGGSRVFLKDKTQRDYPEVSPQVVHDLLGNWLRQTLRGTPEKTGWGRSSTRQVHWDVSSTLSSVLALTPWRVIAIQEQACQIRLDIQRHEKHLSGGVDEATLWVRLQPSLENMKGYTSILDDAGAMGDGTLHRTIGLTLEGRHVSWLTAEEASVLVHELGHALYLLEAPKQGSLLWWTRKHFGEEAFPYALQHAWERHARLPLLETHEDVVQGVARAWWDLHVHLHPRRSLTTLRRDLEKLAPACVDIPALFVVDRHPCLAGESWIHLLHDLHGSQSRLDISEVLAQLYHQTAAWQLWEEVPLHERSDAAQTLLKETFEV